MKISSRLASLTAVAVALTAMTGRSLDVAARSNATTQIEESVSPRSVVWGIANGDPADPAWLEGVQPVVGEPMFWPVVLLALARDGACHAPEVRAFAESLLAKGSSCERAIARYALR